MSTPVHGREAYNMSTRLSNDTAQTHAEPQVPAVHGKPGAGHDETAGAEALHHVGAEDELRPGTEKRRRIEKRLKMKLDARMSVLVRQDLQCAENCSPVGVSVG